MPKKAELIEEKFTKNFSENGGKFLYASNFKECNYFFNKILDENDWKGWKELNKSIGAKCQIIADDLTVTNKLFLKKLIKNFFQLFPILNF